MCICLLARSAELPGLQVLVAFTCDAPVPCSASAVELWVIVRGSA